VGENNHPEFVAFSTISFLALAVGLVQLFTYFPQGSILASIFHWLIILHNGFVELWVTMLTSFHYYLVAKNLSSNESINHKRYSYLWSGSTFKNMFDRGVLMNCVRFWDRRSHSVSDSDEEQPLVDIQHYELSSSVPSDILARIKTVHALEPSVGGSSGHGHSHGNSQCQHNH